MKKIVITGASGFFGKNLIRRLLKEEGLTLIALSGRAKELEAAGTLPLTGTLKAGAEENPNNYKLLADRLLDNEASDQATANDYYVAFAIHMDENASNAYQGNTMKLDLKLQIDANFKPGADPTTATDTDKSL